MSRGVPPQWVPRHPPAGRASKWRFHVRVLIAKLAVWFGGRIPIRRVWGRLEDFQGVQRCLSLGFGLDFVGVRAPFWVSAGLCGPLGVCVRFLGFLFAFIRFLVASRGFLRVHVGFCGCTWVFLISCKRSPVSATPSESRRVSGSFRGLLLISG